MKAKKTQRMDCIMKPDQSKKNKKWMSSTKDVNKIIWGVGGGEPVPEGERGSTSVISHKPWFSTIWGETTNEWGDIKTVEMMYFYPTLTPTTTLCTKIEHVMM